VLLVKRDGSLEPRALVVPDSARAVSAGRAIVRAEAADLDGYVILFDQYLRESGGERMEAIFFEIGSSEDTRARVFARPYVRGADGEARWDREAIEVGTAPLALRPLDPFELDWGSITPDVCVDKLGAVIHVANADLADAANVARLVRVLAARVKYFRRLLPPELGAQWIRLDDRGQPLEDAARARLRSALRAVCDDVGFLSEEAR
jgi:hypothetical protein